MELWHLPLETWKYFKSFFLGFPRNDGLEKKGGKMVDVA